MEHSSAIPRGRERRRTDLYGRCRRAFYGVLLFLAHAAPALAGTPQQATAKQMRNTASTPALPFRQQADQQLNQRWVVLDSHIIQKLQPALFDEPYDWEGVLGAPERATVAELVRFRLDELPQMVDGIARVKNGLGIDVKLPGVGAVFLDIYQPKKRKKRDPGVRWSLNLDGQSAAEPDALLGSGSPTDPSQLLWAFGGSVDLVRNHLGQQKLMINPQLRMIFGDKQHGQYRFEATMAYALWRPATEKVTAGERVLQAELRWRFGN